ncbi:hypothetical protein TALC_00512 [Thermoplasmatales archaeon BRNA1]|nr:hypothetical protein TALC_00512 [Thermoplasmatales archaeon BRNA1]
MIIKGRAISPGRAEGKAITYPEAFSFLGGVDGRTGNFNVRDGNIGGKVFIFPNGKGSTVGSYVVYDLKVQGHPPAALINRSAETIVTTGAVISSVPMVDGIDVSVFRDGDDVVVNGSTGEVEIKNVTLKPAVSSALVHNGKVLLLRRPDDARSFPGKWSLVSGHIEEGETPEEAARREIEEETGVKVSSPRNVQDAFCVREGNTVWEIHPFLFAVDSEMIDLSPENVDFAWVECAKVGCDKLVDGVEKIVREF